MAWALSSELLASSVALSGKSFCDEAQLTGILSVIKNSHYAFCSELEVSALQKFSYSHVVAMRALIKNVIGLILISRKCCAKLLFFSLRNIMAPKSD
jgi:hypothetical protein